MRRNTTRLSRRYVVALRQHLKQGPRASLQPADRLGRQAVAIGLETLDVARMNEQALLTLVLPSYSASARAEIIKRAGIFFAEVIIPIEETHRAALEMNAQLNQLNKTLGQRTAALAASSRHLKRQVNRRHAVEESLKKSGKRYTKLLKDSRNLQDRSRHLTRQILSVHEEGRKKMSHELHDEIAQALLGIDVRLVTLKQEATVNMKRLNKEIASTQRLVEKSAKIVHWFARGIGGGR